jgi:hypothetical protein
MNKNLEIELKFQYQKVDFEKKLNEYDNECCKNENVHIVEFTDDYFDNEEFYFLTKNDFWLRTRNITNKPKKWELKTKYNNKNDNSTKNIHLYYEIDDPIEIAKQINDLIETKGFFNNFEDIKDKRDIDQIIQNFNLTIFASIKTKRKTYHLKNELRIDLDETDFGYCIGEMEALIINDKDHPPLQQQSIEYWQNEINNTSLKLGFYLLIINNIFKKK